MRELCVACNEEINRTIDDEFCPECFSSYLDSLDDNTFDSSVFNGEDE